MPRNLRNFICINAKQQTRRISVPPARIEVYFPCWVFSGPRGVDKFLSALFLSIHFSENEHTGPQNKNQKNHSGNFHCSLMLLPARQHIHNISKNTIENKRWNRNKYDIQQRNRKRTSNPQQKQGAKHRHHQNW